MYLYSVERVTQNKQTKKTNDGILIHSNRFGLGNWNNIFNACDSKGQQLIITNKQKNNNQNKKHNGNQQNTLPN
jgi:hypothetical protein